MLEACTCRSKRRPICITIVIMYSAWMGTLAKGVHNNNYCSTRT